MTTIYQFINIVTTFAVIMAGMVAQAQIPVLSRWGSQGERYDLSYNILGPINAGIESNEVVQSKSPAPWVVAARSNVYAEGDFVQWCIRRIIPKQKNSKEDDVIWSKCGEKYTKWPFMHASRALSILETAVFQDYLYVLFLQGDLCVEAVSLRTPAQPFCNVYVVKSAGTFNQTAHISLLQTGDKGVGVSIRSHLYSKEELFTLCDVQQTKIRKFNVDSGVNQDQRADQ